MIGQIRAVMQKELLEHVRDRRSVMTAMMMPLLGPVMFAVMFNLIASWQNQDKVLELPVAGAERAPNLMKYLARAGAEVKPAPADYEQQVKDGDLDAVLVVPAEFGDDFERGHPAKLELVVDSSRHKAQATVRRAKKVLQAYGSRVAVLRLLARGVSPELANAVDVDEVDLATSEKMAANALNMIPMFLLLAAFMGGMHLAIDSTAGERERGSLEPLLVNPVGRQWVVLGKWAATVVSTLATVALTLFAFKLAVAKVPLEDLGVKAHFGAEQMALMAVVAIPLALMAAAIQMLVSTFARSFREAQQYISLLVMVPMLPAAFLGISPIKEQAGMMLVPFLSHDILVMQAMRGDPMDPAWLGLSVLSTLAVAAACLYANVRLLRREQIVFGR